MSALKSSATFLPLVTSFVPAAYSRSDVFNFRDNSVSATFFDENVLCVFTSASVFAGENTTHVPGDPKQFNSNVSVSIFQVNFCSNEILIDVFGSQPLTASNFQVSPSLGTAALNANTSAFDFLSGTNVGVAIALAWTATEAVTSGHTISHQSFPGIRIHNRSSGKTRLARATGIFTVLGTNFASLPISFASISKSNGGSVTIIR